MEKGNTKFLSIKSNLPRCLDWLRLYRDYRPSTITATRSRLKVINRWFVKNRLEFNRQNFEKYILYCRDNKTHNRYLEAMIDSVRRYCDYLVAIDLIAYNWAKEIPMPKRISRLPNVLSTQEMAEIIKTSRKYTYKPREQKRLYTTVISLLCKTGMRVGEVTSLLIRDLNFADKTIKIRETKTRRERLVPMPPDLVKVLERLVRSRDPTDHLFIGVMSKNKLPIRLINNELHARAEIAGIKKPVHAHILRHSFVTEMLRANPPGGVAVVSKIVGHVSPMLTLTTYQHLIIDDMKKALLFYPLVKKNLDPHDLIKTIRQDIKSYRFQDDKRFFYQLTEGRDGIRLDLFYLKK